MPKLLKLGCALKFIPPEHKYLACILIMILRMNTLSKNIATRAEKILVLVLLFSKLLNHNYRLKQTSLSKNLLKNKVLRYLFHCSDL